MAPVLGDDLEEAKEPQASKRRRVMIPPPEVNYHPPSFAGTDKSKELKPNYAASVIRMEKNMACSNFFRVSGALPQEGYLCDCDDKEKESKTSSG